MTSSPTPHCPAPSPQPPQARRKTRLVQHSKPLAAAALGLLLTSQACAHGDMASAAPDEPGVRLGLSGAVSQINASALLPSARLAGYLLQGDSGIDRRGAQLEHAVAEVGWRLSDTWATSVAIGQHGSDQAHLEAAWVQARRPTPDGQWQLTAGRQRPELGPVITQAGHLDRFALVPLAKRMAVNDDWVDDGLQLGWRSAGAADVQWSADAGVWKGQVFPGSSAASAAPALHLGASWGDWRLDGFAARLNPQGRGAQINNANGAHSHSAPLCDAALKQVICFDGSSDVAGASLRWDSHQWPVSVSAAGLVRRDSGSLSSANGSAQYRGNNRGGWVDAVWRFHPRAQVGVRAERIEASHSLNGPGAALLSTEAGFSAYAPMRRNALMLGWRVSDNVDLHLETGRETALGSSARFSLLRLVVKTDFSFPMTTP
jgi:hypothetical protein